MKNQYINKKYSYALAMPGLIIFVIFFIVPSIIGIGFSFMKMLGLNFENARFCGIENYISIFQQPQTRRAVTNSVTFALVTTIFKMLFGMLLALALNRKLPLTNIFRTVFFLPAVINTVAVGLIFSSMMHPTQGLINTFLNTIGLSDLTRQWLVDPSIAIFSVCAIEIWKWSGFTMVILLSGMQSINKDYYESAELDGATFWEKFRYITFPLLLPAFNNALILSIIGGLKVFDIIQSTTQGGPGSATEVFGTFIFKCFGAGRFGEGCAANIVLSILVALVVIPTYKYIADREVEM